MRLLSTLFLLVGLSALVAAPAKDGKDDLKKLTGDWAVTAWKQAGEALDKENLEGARWTVKDGKYTFELGGNTEEGTIKVDPSKKVAAIDLTITEGNDKGKEQPGIYKIDGDTITFCFARPGAATKDRPTEFTSTEDNQNILITMKKKKRDD